MTCGIYQIRNLRNGKRYVGSSQDVESRWKGHRWNLRKGTHQNRHLQAAWNKYGECRFVFEILEKASEADRITKEQAALDAIPVELRYNIGKCVCPAILGLKMTAETRRKVGQCSRENWKKMDPKVKAARNAKVAEATRQRLNNPSQKREWMQSILKPSTKRLLSAAASRNMKAKWANPEIRAKLCASMSRAAKIHMKRTWKARKAGLLPMPKQARDRD